MRLFWQDSTGRTQATIDALNAEWEARATRLGLDPKSDAYAREADRFIDEVAARPTDEPAGSGATQPTENVIDRDAIMKDYIETRHFVSEMQELND